MSHDARGKKSGRDRKVQAGSGRTGKKREIWPAFLSQSGTAPVFSQLGEHFFAGEFTLEKWMDQNTAGMSKKPSEILSLKKNLNKLKKKGVILEC